MNKSDLLNRLEEKYKQWQVFLEQIGVTRMDQAGVNGVWTMKDTIAHLTGWNRWLVARLKAAQCGEPAPLPEWPAHLQSEDDINAWIYESGRQRSVGDVLDGTRRVFQELFTVIEGLPGDVRIERIEPEYYLVWVGDDRFLVSEFFDHFHDDHEPDVCAWLAQGVKHER